MRRLLLAAGSFLVCLSCAHAQEPSRNTTRPVVQDSGEMSTEVTNTLLALAQEWVDTWNQRDIERMAGMHGDVTHTVYVIGETFTNVEWLLREIRDKKFWDLSWKIRMVEPHVRVLGADAGLVSFRLVGEEAGAHGTKPFSAAFTLVYQKLDGHWKIVHVQDSSRLETPNPVADNAVAPGQ